MDIKQSGNISLLLLQDMNEFLFDVAVEASKISHYHKEIILHIQ